MSASNNIKSQNLNLVIDYNDLDTDVFILTASYNDVHIRNFPKDYNAIFDIRGRINNLYIEESYISNLRAFRVLCNVKIENSHIEFINIISSNVPNVDIKNSTIEISQNNNLQKNCNIKNIVTEVDRITFKGYTFLFPLNKKICHYEHTHLKPITTEDYDNIREVLTPNIIGII